MATFGASEQLISEFEGFRPAPYWDVNALRTGFGSDTATLADGRVIPVTEGTRVTREDAARDLARRTAEFQSGIVRDIGPEAWAAMGDGQKAALSSIAYNYGSLPQRVTSVIAAGGDVAAAIRGLGGDNEGVNRGRRNREADVFAGAETLTGGGGSDFLAGGGGDRGSVETQEERIHRFYREGLLSPEMRSAYEARFGTPDTAQTPPAPQPDLPQSVIDAYNAGNLNPENTKLVSDFLNTPQAPSADIEVTGDPSQSAEFGAITSQMTAEGRENLGRYVTGIFNPDESPSLASMPADWNEGLKRIYAPLADIGMAALSGVDVLATGAAGLAGDVAGVVGAGEPAQRRIARDIAAIPEAFAGSPTTFPPRGPLATRSAPSAPVPALTDSEVGALARRAAGSGPGSARAKEQLAEVARVNPEAQDAARRLGIELPADVFSDDPRVRSTAGLSRSAAASQAESDWRETVDAAISRADEAFAEIDATPDLSSISQRTLAALKDSREAVHNQAKALHTQVRDTVGGSTRVGAENTTAVLNRTLEELGGPDGLSRSERKLYDMLTSGKPVTYARIMREKAAVGDARFSNKGEYADLNDKILTDLYNALTQDQRAAVEAVGDAELLSVLDDANRLTVRQKDIENRLTAGFGRDHEGSIANKLRNAITQGAKGDDKSLTAVLNIIPEDLRGEAVVSAISSLSQGRRAAEGGFGFAEYSKMYRGLRQNSKVYSALVKEIGPERAKVLQDMAQVARRITEARANVLSTGKANQGIVNSALAEGVMSSLLNSSTGRVIRGGVGAATGAAASGGNPLGAAVGASLSGGAVGKDRMEALGTLFASPQFQKAMTEAARTASISNNTTRRLSRSPSFRAWARANGIDNPDVWLRSAITSSLTRPEDQPEEGTQ